MIEGADVVANLAGAPLAHLPWTAAYRRTFTDSRVATTARWPRPSPARPQAGLLAQNGIAGYGDRGDGDNEEAPIDADTFMGGVVRPWEPATAPAAEAGARVVVMRTA